jgi:hypothetical protein
MQVTNVPAAKATARAFAAEILESSKRKRGASNVKRWPDVQTRASIFEEASELDVESFAPKAVIDTKAPPAEPGEAVTQAAKFRSRGATPRKTEARPEAHCLVKSVGLRWSRMWE